MVRRKPNRPPLSAVIFLAVGVVSIASLTTYVVTRKAVQPPPAPIVAPPATVTVDEPGEPPATFATGWVADPAAVQAVVETLPIANFRDTPAGKAVRGDEPESVFLWKAVEQVTGKPCPIHDQNPVGSCVSFGNARAYEKTLAVQITQGDRFEWRSVVEEIIYAGSRVEIGGGRIRGDGSIGAWAAKFITEYGAIPRGTYTAGGQTYDLTGYDPNRCRSWGRSGVPDQLEAEVKKYPAGDATMVTSAAEAKKALAQGYAIAVCSDQGFTMQRDANGVCRPRGQWMHCMQIDGYTQINGRLHFHIENSWGSNAHTGPVGPGDPSTAGFWAEESVVDRMLRQKDSFAFSAVKGFPARRIDWFNIVRRAEPRRDNPLSLERPDYALAP